LLRNLNLFDRRMRTRTFGGVEGERQGKICRPSNHEPCTRRSSTADNFLQGHRCPGEVFAFIAAEVLAVKGGARKKGLNRGILATSPALFLHMLRAKAEEAGLAWLKVPPAT